MRNGVEVLRGARRSGRGGPTPCRTSTETYVVPDGYEVGWTFTAPVVEMPVYLDWLAGVVLERGGTITRMNLSGSPVPAPTWWSTAPASRRGSSPRDPTVAARCRARWSWSSRSGWSAGGSTRAGPTYVVPRAHDIVVGGTDVEGEWSRTPSPEVASAILRRALRLVPELAGAEVLGHRVGLRPARPEVRLERVERRRPLLRPRRRRRDPQLGLRRGGRGPGSAEARAQPGGREVAVELGQNASRGEPVCSSSGRVSRRRPRTARPGWCGAGPR